MILQGEEDQARAFQRPSTPTPHRDEQVEEQPPPYHTLSALPEPGPSRDHALPPLPPSSSSNPSRRAQSATPRSTDARPPPTTKRPTTLVLMSAPAPPSPPASALIPSAYIPPTPRARTHSAPQRPQGAHPRNATTVSVFVPPRARITPSTATLPAHARARATICRPPLLDAPAMNGIFISMHDEPITGSWRIDPDLRMAAAAPPPTAARVRPRRARKAMATAPNLAFDTRRGAIRARLGIVGRARGEGRKASVRVTTRSGAVRLDVQEKSAGRYLDLDVYSKRGDSTLLLPKSFAGVIELHSRKGKLEVLAALARDARVLKATDEEILLLVGAGDTAQLADYVRYASRAGTLRVGYTEEDDREEAVVGFWRRLGRLLTVGVGEKARVGDGGGGITNKNR